jgi:hypothetical protein
MKKIFMVVALIGGMVEPALACHRFRVWHYPWPQRCPVALDGHRTPVRPVAEAPMPRPVAESRPALAPLQPDPGPPALAGPPSAEKGSDKPKVNDLPVNPLD